jgi:hypothetical protein
MHYRVITARRLLRERRARGAQTAVIFDVARRAPGARYGAINAIRLCASAAAR